MGWGFGFVGSMLAIDGSSMLEHGVHAVGEEEVEVVDCKDARIVFMSEIPTFYKVPRGACVTG